GPAYAGIPVTHRADNSHVTFFTGHEDPAKIESAIDYAALAKLGGTQVMLMGVERLEPITREMLKQGVQEDLPVALVRWATTGRFSQARTASKRFSRFSLSSMTMHARSAARGSPL